MENQNTLLDDNNNSLQRIYFLTEYAKDKGRTSCVIPKNIYGNPHPTFKDCLGKTFLACKHILDEKNSNRLEILNNDVCKADHVYLATNKQDQYFDSYYVDFSSLEEEIKNSESFIIIAYPSVEIVYKILKNNKLNTHGHGHEYLICLIRNVNILCI